MHLILKETVSQVKLKVKATGADNVHHKMSGMISLVFPDKLNPPLSCFNTHRQTNNETEKTARTT